MEGRRLIVFMVVGGMTQYLTKVQRMPAEVEHKLEKRIRNFLWAEKTSVTINKETIYAPTELGGRNLLDIIARNEVITVTWLKSYLSFNEDRPLWAFVADELYARNALGDDINVEEALCKNMYLQSWRTNTRNGKLPKDLINMVKVAKKHELSIDGLAISRNIQREMPVWYHNKSRATRRLFNYGEQVGCLWENHNIRTVGEAETLARKAGTTRHMNRPPAKPEYQRPLDQHCTPNVGLSSMNLGHMCTTVTPRPQRGTFGVQVPSKGDLGGWRGVAGAGVLYGGRVDKLPSWHGVGVLYGGRVDKLPSRHGVGVLYGGTVDKLPSRHGVGVLYGGMVDKLPSRYGVGVLDGGTVDKLPNWRGAGVLYRGRVDKLSSQCGVGVLYGGRVDKLPSRCGVGVLYSDRVFSRCGRVDMGRGYHGMGYTSVVEWTKGSAATGISLWAYGALLHDVIYPKAILLGMYQVQGTVVHDVQGTLTLVRGTGYCCSLKPSGAQ
ncbi:hypothetical protein C8F04DRAFT_1196800 [Mycena alexandri]|uniref:Uncharacterized protein n=1 Tax=Mycena alexandri TaxID=1745969 RepID=A0AAD6S743_9AGAR|nr:hypothetical protein C8F04DRAFT_1196800 [Mycena alexandri]